MSESNESELTSMEGVYVNENHYQTFFCKLKSKGCTINMNVKYWCTWQHFFKPVIY